MTRGHVAASSPGGSRLAAGHGWRSSIEMSAPSGDGMTCVIVPGTNEKEN